MVAPVVEEDFQPLVRTKGGEKKDDVDSSLRRVGVRAQLFLQRHGKVSAILFAASFLSLLLLSSHLINDSSGTSVTKKKHHWAWGKCAKTCSAHQELHEQKWGGNLMDTATANMLRRATQEQEKLEARLKVNYGEEYYRRIFNESGISIAKSGFEGANNTLDISRKRFVRKLKMKILSVQVALQEEAKNVDGCNCGVRQKGKNRYLQGSGENEEENENASTDDPMDALPDYYARMVFVNGGHSSSAGHGNLFKETYTAVTESSAKDAFAAVGIDFEGRNYAMGGMSSAPELALCSEAVYGLDADLLTWNFGMTDGWTPWRHSLYTNRRGVHRNRPLVLDIDSGYDWGGKLRAEVLREIEEAGLATMQMSVSFMYHLTEEQQEWFPDTQTMTQAEIDAVPEYLRYFRCGEKIEEGDPFCNKKKYTDTCVPGAAPWHPGWKAHALMGNILATFMIDLLLDALKEILEEESSGDVAEQPLDPKDMLAQLQSEEDKDYERFFNSSLPDYEFVKSGLWNESITEDHKLLFRHPIVCHTAIRPADTRYKGYLTEMENSSFENFEQGMSREDANKLNATITSKMLLVDGDVKHRTDCEPSGQGLIDSKDYFYVSTKSGSSSLVIPNKAEREVYLPEGHQFYGLIVVCPTTCPWGNCPEGFIKFDDLADNKFSFFVNGKEVKEFFPVDTCTVLRGEHGYKWEPNEDGTYEFTAKVNVPSGFLQIQSISII